MKPSLLPRIPRQTFWNFFRRKKQPEAQLQPTYSDYLEHYRQPMKTRQPQVENEISRFYQDLKEQRLREEKIREENAQAIAEATEAAMREQEIDLNRNDRRKLLLSAVTVLPDRAFSSVDELLYYYRSIDLSEVNLSEESSLKIITGVLHFASEISSEELRSPQFKLFLDSLRGTLSVMQSIPGATHLARMLDLCCVSYPELWAKLEDWVIARMRQASTEQLLALLQAFSNQGEGSPLFYQKVEQRLTADLPSLTSADAVVALSCFYNALKGSKPFVYKLLDAVQKGFDPAHLKAISTILAGLQEGKESMLKTIEEHLLQHRPHLEPDALCAAANAFGFDYGCEELFAYLRAEASTTLRPQNLEDFKQICSAFIFTYRSPAPFLEEALTHLPQHIHHLSPLFLARLAKSLHIFEQDGKPADVCVHRQILSLLKTRPDSLTKDDVAELALTFLLTRNATRELYRVLEILLRKQLDRYEFDNRTLDALIEAYSLSGLCTPGLLASLRWKRGTGPHAL